MCSAATATRAHSIFTFSTALFLLYFFFQFFFSGQFVRSNSYLYSAIWWCCCCIHFPFLLRLYFPLQRNWKSTNKKTCIFSMQISQFFYFHSFAPRECSWEIYAFRSIFTSVVIVEHTWSTFEHFVQTQKWKKAGHWSASSFGNIGWRCASAIDFKCKNFHQMVVGCVCVALFAVFDVTRSQIRSFTHVMLVVSIKISPSRQL